MRLLYLFFLISGALVAQTTATPDSNFKKTIIFRGFNTSVPDGFVITASIDTITILNPWSPFDISDLMGI